ncbi:CTD small phosphatase-like protein [Rhynchospora pubera]|uniref:Mitochondrial import inner membrane translocase subunit TIM50 n=1 Tax=Rhynchospora pubera TaxID=906938 RepID=A0AAV8CGI7_9POAL|nr:CTD small phosphatase-like protein [Rhynchospora pubera]
MYFMFVRALHQSRVSLFLILPEKTLFLDLDETLVKTHVSGSGKPSPSYQYDFVIKEYHVKKRPGIDKLLQVATDYGYEIVIFTAGRSDYASPIIKRLDPKGLITHWLYRDSCSDSVHCIKDLAATGRSLDKCVIVDDKWSRVLQTENVIRIREFTGDMKDSELTRLLCFFKIEREYKDLRDAVRHVNYQLGYLKKRMSIWCWL